MVQLCVRDPAGHSALLSRAVLAPSVSCAFGAGSVRMGRWRVQGLRCCRRTPTPAHRPLSGTLQAASFHSLTVPLYRKGTWGASAQKCPKSESPESVLRPESLCLNRDQHISAAGPRQSQGVSASATVRPAQCAQALSTVLTLGSLRCVAGTILPASHTAVAS